MKKLLLSALFTLLAHTAARAQNWTWSGEASSDWDNPGNWTNIVGGVLVRPDPLSDFTSATTLRLLGTGDFQPSNQNIPDLALHTLQVGELITDLIITGAPITFQNGYHDAVGNDGFTVTFSNNIAFAGNWGGNLARTIHYYGEITETVPGVVLTPALAYGNAHFHGPVSVSGGIRPQWDTFHFYGMDTTGAALDEYTPAFFGNNNGAYTFHLPDGKDEYIYELPFEKGVMGRVSLTALANVEIILHTPVTNNNNLVDFYAIGDGIIELNAAHHPFTGNIRPRGLTIVHGTFADGEPTALLDIASNAVDLNGVDLAGRNMIFDHANGRHADGSLRNQNPDVLSTVACGITALANANTHNKVHFGGVGDILFTGNITNASVNATSLQKTGPGALTVTGRMDYQGPMTLYNGVMTLDYDRFNDSKIGDESALNLAGTLALLGNSGADTVETIGSIAIGFSGQGNNAATRISPDGRNGHKASFRFNTWSWVNRNTLDLDPGENGAILASNVFNNADLHALTPRVTFNGASYARVSENPLDKDGDGYRRIEPLPKSAYSNSFDNTTIYKFVDLAGDVEVPAGDNEYAAAIRFNSPGPATLTLNGALRLLGEGTVYGANGGNNVYGGILVTPNVGPNEVVITGAVELCMGCYNGPLLIHQYNTAAPLTITVPINNYSGNALLKTGPGELVLRNPQSSIGIILAEGILSFPDIADAGERCSIGATTPQVQMANNTTLRYIGEDPAGHASNRQIQLRGKCAIEACGDGPLILTNAVTIAVNGGGNPLLTLGGKGAGVITGELQLNGGRLRKRGGGTWTLTETSHSSCVWGAEIFNGTLVLDGSFGRDVTVHNGGTLAGSGRVKRNLIVKDGGTLLLDPSAGAMSVGHNLVLEPGAKLALPPKFRDTMFAPILDVEGEITGAFTDIPAAIRLQREGNTLLAKYQSPGTLFIVR